MSDKSWETGKLSKLSHSHSLSLDLLNNFCFHVYAQKSLSHSHTLSHSLLSRPCYEKILDRLRPRFFQPRFSVKEITSCRPCQMQNSSDLGHFEMNCLINFKFFIIFSCALSNFLRESDVTSIFCDRRSHVRGFSHSMATVLV